MWSPRPTVFNESMSSRIANAFEHQVGCSMVVHQCKPEHKYVTCFAKETEFWSIALHAPLVQSPTSIIPPYLEEIITTDHHNLVFIDYNGSTNLCAPGLVKPGLGLAHGATDLMST